MGEMNEQAHRLLLEQRKTLSLGGVQDVKSFDENEVLLVTVCGVLTIRGKELHVGRLELEKGEADIEGSIDSLVYTEHGPLQKKGSALARLFQVKMSAYVTRELILLACSIWQGAVLGFWYDLIKTARKLIRHSHAAVSARGPLLLDCGSAVSVCTDLRREQRHSPWVSVWRHPWGRALYHASFGRFLPELLAKGTKKAGRILAFPGKWLVKSMKKRRKRLKFHGKNGKM